MLLRTPLLIALALASVACGGGGNGGARPDPCPATTTIDTKDAVNFVPKCATVAAGSAVTWRNIDGIPHTVTFTSGGDFDKYFEKDQSVTRTMTTAGTFEYYCKVHGRVMSGKLVVTAAPSS